MGWFGLVWLRRVKVWYGRYVDGCLFIRMMSRMGWVLGGGGW